MIPKHTKKGRNCALATEKRTYKIRSCFLPSFPLSLCSLLFSPLWGSAEAFLSPRGGGVARRYERQTAHCPRAAAAADLQRALSSSPCHPLSLPLTHTHTHESCAVRCLVGNSAPFCFPLPPCARARVCHARRRRRRGRGGRWRRRRGSASYRGTYAASLHALEP